MAIDATALPSQLSVYPAYGGYAEYRALGPTGRRVMVLVDGVRVDRCFASDRDAGVAFAHGPTIRTLEGKNFSVIEHRGVLTYALLDVEEGV